MLDQRSGAKSRFLSLVNVRKKKKINKEIKKNWKTG